MVDEKLQDAFRQVRRLMNEDLDKLEKGVMAGLDTGNAELAETERKLAAAERSVHILTLQVKIAQNREKELLEENTGLYGQIARLNAKLQGVRDQLGDVSDVLPTVDDIAAGERGEPHKAVNGEIKDSAVNIEKLEAEMNDPAFGEGPHIPRLRGLAMLLDTSRVFSRHEKPEPDPLAVTKFQVPEFPEEPRRVEA